MKCVLISIKPKYCELIASGKKTVEIRKTRPKFETPFKCYIYCTKSNKHDFGIGKPISNISKGRYFGNGKVIGEFVCDYIYENMSYDCEGSCVSVSDLKKYANGKTLYGWHISDLKIYDKPKDIAYFRTICNYRNADGTCQWEKVDCDCQKAYLNEDISFSVECLDFMSRPPQSWCYVEEVWEE